MLLAHFISFVHLHATDQYKLHGAWCLTCTCSYGQIDNHGTLPYLTRIIKIWECFHVEYYLENETKVHGVNIIKHWWLVEFGTWYFAKGCTWVVWWTLSSWSKL
jgi:hypothetical protein